MIDRRAWLLAAPRIAVFGILAWVGAVVQVTAQDTVNIDLPAAISFQVMNVSQSSSGSPNPARIAFSSANLTAGNTVRVSVRADAANFAPPSGPSIPASRVTWANAGALGGIGFDGTLSSSSYGVVLQSNPGATSGRVDLNWTLLAPGAGVRAGAHQLTIRWKVESITP